MLVPIQHTTDEGRRLHLPEDCHLHQRYQSELKHSAWPPLFVFTWHFTSQAKLLRVLLGRKSKMEKFHARAVGEMSALVVLDSGADIGLLPVAISKGKSQRLGRTVLEDAQGIRVEPMARDEHMQKFTLSRRTQWFWKMSSLLLQCKPHSLAKAVMLGESGDVQIMNWKSHACPRMCRSTFAAETIAALEGWEAVLATRAMIAGCLGKPNTEVLPIYSMTDCKSLCDSQHTELEDLEHLLRRGWSWILRLCARWCRVKSIRS